MKAIQASLPLHLRKYVVEQDYNRYTPRDHAVWRLILRQLKAFLGVHAHESYLEGLEKTGIEIDRIPKISDISEKLKEFGWKAVPVSGFIPPAAFMEMQSLGILPIASDMRSLEHLLYTPAPDIVHEAAGHAPMLVHPEYASYLQQYAQVAKKAIISKHDLEVYAAIRDLSDIKEDPESDARTVAEAEARLEEVVSESCHISEATQLSRMNWWTAEYGLIGSLKSPRIFGAGLLSSLGEARDCLDARVKKIPLSVECIEVGYDITEPQPQLFVASDFKNLQVVLDEMSQKMAFKVGGVEGLKKAQSSETVNSLQLNSGLQISGRLEDFKTDAKGQVYFVNFSGPCQLSEGDLQLDGHGPDFHRQGYSSPLGPLKNNPERCPSSLSEFEWQKNGVIVGSKVDLHFVSGVEVSGKIKNLIVKNGRSLLLTFTECSVTCRGEVWFEPSWGEFDMALGTEIISVFGGPADLGSFGLSDDFVAKRVPVRKYSAQERKLFSLYQKVRDWRESSEVILDLEDQCQALMHLLSTDFEEEWLLRLEVHELLMSRQQGAALKKQIQSELQNIIKKLPHKREVIEDGMRISGIH